MHKLLCWLEFHTWEYNKDKTKRWCKYCGKCQEKCLLDLFWATCIDGEPIEEPQPR